jgi:hypoxanthine-DNA glycosylase
LDAAERLLRGLPPVLSPGTRLVVLGSFPGRASLQAGEYYAHPRNQFWPLLSALWGLDLRALPYAQRLAVVGERGLGVWDVYANCRRAGSLDSAIRDARPNDLALLLRRAPGLRAVAHNGGESAGAGRGGAPPALQQPGQRELELRAQAAGLARGVPGRGAGLMPTGAPQ